ncbi:MAG TPA: hypothetical protein VNQ80_08175 [Parapedobacter sp.]|uniref:hypothetical protein n=1 Tax=Parapedobacter sp. TaxID=1958893 RepID=UPI002CB6C144|nr:hypothetical protein [Parapedobacter sp.]HWK57298.1 hypothetical protein [Parapedobacter sp.]
MQLAIVNMLIELACFVVAWLRLRHDPERHWALFPWYLFVVVVTETAGFYLGRIVQQPSNWVYNLYILIEGTFISYFIYRVCRPYGLAPVLWKGWVLLFICCYATERFLASGLNDYSTYTIMLMNVSFIGAFIGYIFRLARSPLQPMPLYRHAPTVWMAAMASFYFGTLATSLIAELLLSKALAIGNTSMYAVIYAFFILLLYGLWIYSIMCRYQNRR